MVENPRNKGKNLTKRQKKYLDIRLTEPTKTQFQAAIEAGYAESTAVKACVDIESAAAIAPVIHEVRNTVIEDLGITTHYVLKNIRDVIEAAKTPFPITNKNGDVIALKIDSKSILRGCELLGKYKELGLWTEKVEHSTNPEQPFELKIILDRENETCADSN